MCLALGAGSRQLKQFVPCVDAFQKVFSLNGDLCAPFFNFVCRELCSVVLSLNCVVLDLTCKES